MTACTRSDTKPGRALASFFRALLVAFVLCAAGGAVAADYVAKLTQYAHVSWRVQDGDLGGAANTIAQTRDGYIWVATSAGLERYDGVRFRHWKLPTEQPLFGLLASRDGSLWASQDGRIFHLHDGVTDELVDSVARYNGLFEDSAGVVWVGRSRGHDGKGGLCQVGRPPFRCFGASDGQPCLFGSSVSQDTHGVYWVGSDVGACQWRPGQAKVTAPAADNMRNLTGVVAFSPEPDGSMLAGFTRSGPHLGLQRITTSGASPFIAGDLNGETLAVRSLLRDREGTLWIGTTRGLYHVVNGKDDHVGRADGLSGDAVDGLYEDREGDIWVATAGGVDKFRRQPLTALTTREGLTADQVYSVVARRDGSIWMGSGEGLDILRNGAITHIGPAEGLPGQAVSSMAEDHAGRFWAGVDNDLAWFDGKSFHIVRKPNGDKLGVMVTLAEDAHSDVWTMSAGNPYRLYRIRGGKFLDEVQLPAHKNPVALASSADGAIWIADNLANLYIYRDGPPTIIAHAPKATTGRNLTILPNDEAVLTSRTGVWSWAKGRWTLVDTSRGMPCSGANSVIRDAKGFLWIRTQCGMVVMASSELARVADDPRAKVKLLLLDAADGAQPGFPTFRPASTGSPDGRLWFATNGPLLTVDPATLSSNALPPPVHVEQIVADHQIYAPGKDVRFPPRTRDVEIDYAGLSLVAPQKTRFRYRLSGIDRDWQDVETRRAAFYMNLKPGHYVFQVIASNNDGVWNKTGDTVAFSIKPAYYQTVWFQALVLFLLLALAAFAVRLRLRAVTHEIETRMSARQAERVRIARELHDTLLQGFQGLIVRFQVVADAIPAGQPAKPMMEAVLDRADEILVQGRDRVRDLRSEEDGGSPFLKALEDVAFTLERDGCPPIDVQLSGPTRPLAAETQQEFVAIAREALTNACRHADARAITCRLDYTASHVRLVVEDDGVGIDETVLQAGGRSGHWGLTGMRERARQAGAALRVRRLSPGTRVEISLNTRLAFLRKLARRVTLVDAP